MGTTKNTQTKNQSVGFNFGKYGFHVNGEDAADVLKNTCRKNGWRMVLISGGIMFIDELGRQAAKWVTNKIVSAISRRTTSKNIDGNVVETIGDPLPINEITKDDCENVEDTRLYANIVHKGDKVLIFGPKGNGKSTFTIDMMAGIAKGSSPLLFPEYGIQHEGQDGIYIDLEQRGSQLKSRYAKDGYELPENLKFVATKKITDLGELRSYLKHIVSTMNTDVTIGLDNVTKVANVLNASQAKELDALLTGIQEEAKANRNINITFILVSHTNKDGYSGSINTNNIKGSSYITDIADAVLAFGPTRFGKQTKMLKVLHNRNEAEPDTVLVMERVDKAPYLHFEKVADMEEKDALPVKPKQCQTYDQSQSHTDRQYSPELLKEIADFYQPGVYGHGLGQIAKRYGSKIGCKNSEEVRRFIAKYITKKP